MRRSRLVTPFAVAAATMGLVLGAAPVDRAAATPSVQVTTVVSGLQLPWDLTWVGDLLLYGLRAGQVWSKRSGASPKRVAISGFPSIFAQSEGGLLGMVADPAAASNHRFYTCQSVRDGSGNPLDVRVLRWRLTSDTTATSDGAPVATGTPLNSGCRLRFGTDGFLYVGTDGATWEREFSPTTATGGWAQRSDGLSTWSDRALGDTWPGRSRLSVGLASDGRPVVQRGSLVVAVNAVWTSAGDIVSRRRQLHHGRQGVATEPSGSPTAARARTRTASSVAWSADLPHPVPRRRGRGPRGGTHVRHPGSIGEDGCRARTRRRRRAAPRRTACAPPRGPAPP